MKVSQQFRDAGRHLNQPLFIVTIKTMFFNGWLTLNISSVINVLELILFCRYVTSIDTETYHAQEAFHRQKQKIAVQSFYKLKAK